MKYHIRQIASMTGGVFLKPPTTDTVIEHILLDSRQISFPATSLFFALKGRHFDGHLFLDHAYRGGIRHFIISKKTAPKRMEAAQFILVDNTLAALQQLAAKHRQQYPIPVIGITGSNGKTIVKEWLFQLLHPDYRIVRSPKSYNSQTGVPLSVLQLNAQHTLGIFEAGISLPAEMEKIAPIIAPQTGIFTNIGEAHSEGFRDQSVKLREKLKLFEKAHTLLYRCDDDMMEKEIKKWKTKTNNPIQLLRWSTQNAKANYFIENINPGETATAILIKETSSGRYYFFKIPFTDSASIENAIHCWVLMKHFGYANDIIAERMARLEHVAMRLELKEGHNGCTIINDSYNSDINSLKIALDFLSRQSQTPARTLVLSDILQSGQLPEKLYPDVGKLIAEKKIEKLIGIGNEIKILKQYLPQNIKQLFFDNTDSFLQNLNPASFINETILLKGARVYNFEKIANLLSAKTHQTVLEVNLTALLNNLRTYQKLLRPGTLPMVMVKAGAYGSGSLEIARLLEFQHIGYLAVAYADEGAELRTNGIQLPILVLNPEESTFGQLYRHHLEPEIYSLHLLEKYIRFLKSFSKKHPHPVHLKFDTGMHRLGLEEKDLPALLGMLKKNKNLIKIKSIFSHLAASENPHHDAFTRQQFFLFEKIYKKTIASIGYQPMRHILNSGGIVRFPQYQMEMVRLGIGLYGIDESGILQNQLQTVNTLKTTISQIKNIEKGETIGYGRMGKATQNMRIATLCIGYADGLPRKAGNGNYAVLIHGTKAPLIGNICMDMAMADITHIPATKEGDTAIIFGKDNKGNELPVQQLAQCLHTIPYEIFTAVSKRVKRVYIQE